MKLLCGRRFATLCALCVVWRCLPKLICDAAFAVVGVLSPHPPATPAADR